VLKGRSTLDKYLKLFCETEIQKFEDGENGKNTMKNYVKIQMTKYENHISILGSD
jgi:hypothetical protein